MKIFRKLLKWRPWMRIPAIILGIACIVAAVWFGFPMIPFEFFWSVWLRLTVIAVIVVPILIVQIVKFLRRRKRAREMEAELVQEPAGDGKVLAERMQSALEQLKKTGGATYLYDLPWYIIIGPPGAGKTTALKNSGIEFPISGDEGDGAMAGFGGTRYCDWWFSEDAILIDTAGRYTTQDSDQEADSNSWTSFLELLKRTRPNQPINGVMLAFSAEDMMTSSEAQLTEHANTVRARLAELHETLRVDFPVYVLFTKSDLISGFREYFSSFGPQRRKHVWGVTFQTKDRTAKTYEDVGPEFDKLVSRLSDEIVDRMNEEPDPISRVAIFGLPGQMAEIRDNVQEFLRKVFAPSKHSTNAILRGFYFTSGTQEGTPIDQVLGAMASTGSTTQAASFMSGQGKSFFLHDLLKKVIFAEQDWVSHDARAVRRTAILRTVGFSAIALGMLGVLGLFGWGFWQNYRLVQETEQAADSYARIANDEINRLEIDDPALEPILPYLDQLRLMDTGYASEDRDDGWLSLGLGQRSRLTAASATAYGDALETMLRPRLILDLERRLPEIRREGDPADVYRALKVYMLLGGQGPYADDEAIQLWFDDQWRGEFGGAFGIEQREQLNRHLAAMLELDDTRDIAIEIDQAAVESARSAIVQMSLADQAYALIQDRAKTAGLRDFNLVETVGSQAPLVFTTTGEKDLSELGVPGLYTYEGFWSYFFDQVLTVGEALERDKWVLGDQAEMVNFDSQLAGLDQALQARYGQDFYNAWQEMFANLELANMAADKPQYDALGAAAAPFASPILQLVQAVSSETRLTEEIAIAMAEEAAAADGGGDGSGVGGQIANRLVNRQVSRTTGVTRIIARAAADGAKNQQRVNGTADSVTRPIEQIEERFRDWHVLLEGPEGQRPIDIVLADLAAIRDNLRLGATNPGQSAALLPQLLSNLTRNNSRLPDEIRDFVNDAERDFRTEASDSTLAEMNRALNNDIAFTCREGITSFFPFTDTQRQLPTATFGQFFGPGGDMDRYFNTYLAPHVIRTGEGLAVDPNSPLADKISPNALRQFDRADNIRRAFFGAGGTNPEVQITVRHTDNHPSVERAQLVINGAPVISTKGDPAKTVSWPGAGAEATVSIWVDGRNIGGMGLQQGPWDIVNLLSRAVSRQPQGNQEQVTFQLNGRTLTYQLSFNAPENPFSMSELREFQCPTSLD